MSAPANDFLGKKEIFLGGKWVSPAEGKFIGVMNPATEGNIGFIGETKRVSTSGSRGAFLEECTFRIRSLC